MRSESGWIVQPLSCHPTKNAWRPMSKSLPVLLVPSTDIFPLLASSSIPITMLSIAAKSYSEAGASSWPSPTVSRRASTPTPVSHNTKRGHVPRGRLIPSRGRVPLRRSPRPLIPQTEEEEGGGGGGEEEEADDVSGQSTRCVATSRTERVY